MSINFTFESEYFEAKIDGFENARRNFANASSSRKKTSKLPKKVRVSFIGFNHFNNALLRFIQRC